MATFTAKAQFYYLAPTVPDPAHATAALTVNAVVSGSATGVVLTPRTATATATIGGPTTTASAATRASASGSGSVGGPVATASATALPGAHAALTLGFIGVSGSAVAPVQITATIILPIDNIHETVRASALSYAEAHVLIAPVAMTGEGGLVAQAQGSAHVSVVAEAQSSAPAHADATAAVLGPVASGHASAPATALVAVSIGTLVAMADAEAIATARAACVFEAALVTQGAAHSFRVDIDATLTLADRLWSATASIAPRTAATSSSPWMAAASLE